MSLWQGNSKRSVRWLAIVLVAGAGLATAPAASADFGHTVAPGESLTSVAAIDGISVEQLAAANGLSPDSELVAGTTLQIPPQGGDSAAPPATAAPAEAPTTSTGGYVVQPGDTLSAIAARFGTSVSALAAINGLDPSGLLLAGASLSLGGEAAPSSSTGESVASAPAGGAQPTAERVDPGAVGSIASAEGVSPSLAEAVADQESGFNNDFVSPAGATGVMQIEPSTWSYIGSTLAGPPPLSPVSAADNVRAGVLLLHSLLDQTGGDPALAAAGYFQGLSSVRSIGLLPSTRRYVADVLALRARFGGP